MSTISVTADIALSLKAQKQGVLNGTPLASEETVTLQIPAKYIDECNIDLSGHARLPTRSLHSINGSILYQIDDIADLKDGLNYMSNWVQAQEKLNSLSKDFLRNFADKVLHHYNDLHEFILQNGLTEAKVVEINLADLQKLDWVANECKNSWTFRDLLVDYIKFGHFEDSYTRFIELVKDEPWFALLIEHLNSLHQAFVAEQSERKLKISEIKKNNLIKEQEISKQAKERERINLEELISWAKLNGSEKLKNMMELNVGDIQKTAEDEFVKAHCPKGFERKTYHHYKNGGSRKNPTLEELDSLKQLRALMSLHPDLYKCENLFWAVNSSYFDNNDNIIKCSQAVLEVNVVTPTGSTYIVVKTFLKTRIDD